MASVDCSGADPSHPRKPTPGFPGTPASPTPPVANAPVGRGFGMGPSKGEVSEESANLVGVADRRLASQAAAIIHECLPRITRGLTQ